MISGSRSFFSELREIKDIEFSGKDEQEKGVIIDVDEEKVNLLGLNLEGLKLGTVCVLDTKPRKVTEKQLQMLETLSSIVLDELELKRATRKALFAQTVMMNRIVHDLKNPSTTISLSAELIKKKANDPKVVIDFADRIKNASNNVLTSLNNLLDLSQIESNNFKLNLKEIDVLEVLATVKGNFELLAQQKKQTVTIVSDCSTIISADADRP